MSLFRTAIVVAVVIAVLPSDRAQQERLQQTVVDAAHWTITFCERNVRTCENAAVAWQGFKTKAEFALNVAYEVGMRHALGNGDIATASTQGQRADPRVVERGTLSDRDMDPAWRATAPRQTP